MATAKTTKSKKNSTTAIEKKNQEATMMSFDYGDEAGQGYDPESAKDIQVPIVVALQALSPQVKSVEKGGIKGAEVGMLYNTVTQELMDSILFVPAKSEKLYVEWIPRKEGGGFVGSHKLDSKLVLDSKKARAQHNATASSEDKEWGAFKLGNGHELVETQYLYCVPVDENNEPMGGMFVMSFTSTKLASWRKWNTAVHSFRIDSPRGKVQPPLYAHVVKLTTVEQTNKHGDFYNFVLSPANESMIKSLVALQSTAFVAAKELKELIESGVARAAEQNSGGADAPAGADDDGDDQF